MTQNTELPTVDEMPVLANMTEKMRLSLAVSESGDVLVFHIGAFSEAVNWAEYNVDLGKIYFITKVGRIQGLGLDVLPIMKDKILNSRPRIFTVQLDQNRQEKEVLEMPLVIQYYQ